MSSPLVTVIVPVYQAESYLEKCFRSLMSQTYDNLEILAVDDESKDGTVRVIEQLGEEDPRVCVLKVPHGGSARARQAGIAAAKGNLIAFIDSDDWAEPHFIEAMVSAMTEHHVDMVTCSYWVDYQDGKRKSVAMGLNRSIEMKGEAILKGFYDRDGSVFETMWNKLYEKQLFDGVVFPDDVAPGEDFCVMTQVLRNTRSAFHVQGLYVHYIQRASSIAHKVGYDSRQTNAVSWFIRMGDEMSAAHPSLRTSIIGFTSEKCLYAVLPMYRGGEKNEEILATVTNYINEHFDEFIRDGHANRLFKGAGIMVVKAPALFTGAYSAWNRMFWKSA